MGGGLNVNGWQTSLNKTQFFKHGQNPNGICRAEKACYKAINQFDCNQHDGCFGCFNDFQEFQCNNKTSISCCSNKNYCNLNLTITKEIQNNANQNVLTISILFLIWTAKCNGVSLLFLFLGFISAPLLMSN